MSVNYMSSSESIFIHTLSISSAASFSKTFLTKSTYLNKNIQLNVNIQDGEAFTPATIINVSPSLNINENGLVTALVSSNSSVAPTISSGWVSNGNAGTISVSGINTLQLSTLSAFTYTPTISNQVIASGKYLIGEQIIQGDENLVASNIANGISIFGISGTLTPHVSSINISANGTIYANSANLDGYSQITTNIHPGLIAPYMSNLTTGYVASGSYILENSSPCFNDVYQVSNNTTYLIMLGSIVGTRFRIMFSTTDTTTTTTNISGINIQNNSLPPSYSYKIYSATENGFLTIQKDNNNNSDIKTYVFELPNLVSSGEATILDGYSFKDGILSIWAAQRAGLSFISKSISINGLYSASEDNVDGYESVDVEVPNSYLSTDEGKVVDSGILVAQTARTSEITENGTYDTTANNSVTVNISSGGITKVEMTSCAQQCYIFSGGGRGWAVYPTSSGAQGAETFYADIPAAYQNGGTIILSTERPNGASYSFTRNRIGFTDGTEDPTNLPDGISYGRTTPPEYYMNALSADKAKQFSMVKVPSGMKRVYWTNTQSTYRVAGQKSYMWLISDIDFYSAIDMQWEYYITASAANEKTEDAWPL